MTLKNAKVKPADLDAEARELELDLQAKLEAELQETNVKSLQQELSDLGAELDESLALGLEFRVKVEELTAQIKALEWISGVAMAAGMLQGKILDETTDRLSRANRLLYEYRSKEEWDAAKERSLAQAMKMPELAKWALLQRFTVVVDGMTIRINPSALGRKMESHSQINERGDITETVTTLSGDGKAYVEIPLFGTVRANCTLLRTETDSANASIISVKNQAHFSLIIGNVERNVTVTAGGFISKSQNQGYPEGRLVAVTPVACSTCGLFHGELFQGEVLVHTLMATITIS